MKIDRMEYLQMGKLEAVGERLMLELAVEVAIEYPLSIAEVLSSIKFLHHIKGLDLADTKKAIRPYLTTQIASTTPTKG